MKIRLASVSLLLIVLVSACGTPPAVETPSIEQALTAAVATLQSQLTATAALPAATETPAPTATDAAPRTPPALPGPYTSSLLNANDTPHAYITDTCQYLRQRWDPANAAPGTVVMVIMIHSITKGEVTEYNQMSVGEFNLMIRDLKQQNFTAINTTQLAGFLESNAWIPARSVILIQDDRKTRENFDTHVYPYWLSDGWPVVNAWISAPGTSEQLWAENAAVEAEGWVDHQAHGVIHNTPASEAVSDEYLLGELQGSIDAFQEHFGKIPIAYIWPGGGFTPHAAALARQTGYRLGFTTNPRGPLMFNWIPLADAADPMRPSYLPDGPVNDPLMVLPRYWSPDARDHIDEVRVIGNEATAYAQANRAVELEYYDIVCAPAYGAIPGVTP